MIPPSAFFVALVLTLLTLPLYLAIIVFLVRKRNIDPYNSAFFKLWLALAFVDILLTISAFLIGRAINYGYFRSVFESQPTGVVLNLINTFIANSSTRAQMSINAIMSINRYTAITMPIKYNLIWSNRNVYRILTVVFAFCVVTSIPSFFTSYTLTWNDAIGAFVLGSSNISILYAMTYVTAIIAAIATLVGIICYSLAIIKYRQQMKNTTAVNTENSNKNNSSQRNIELSLLMSALLTFVTMITAIIVMIFLIFANWYVADLPAYNAWTIVNTLFSMVSPWTLLVCSKQLRQSLFADIRKILGLSSSIMVHPIVMNNH